MVGWTGWLNSRPNNGCRWTGYRYLLTEEEDKIDAKAKSSRLTRHGCR